MAVKNIPKIIKNKTAKIIIGVIKCERSFPAELSILLEYGTEKKLSNLVSSKKICI